MTTTVPVYDGDPSFINFDGQVRLRYNPAANALQLLVSVNNGDGTWSVSTFNLTGSLRATRKINTQWPAYATTGLPMPFRTSGDETTAELLEAQSNGRVPGGAQDRPISAADAKNG